MPSLPRYLLRALRHSFPLMLLMALAINLLDLWFGYQRSSTMRLASTILYVAVGVVLTILIVVAVLRAILTRPARSHSRRKVQPSPNFYTFGNLSRNLGVGLLFLAVLVVLPALLVGWLGLAYMPRMLAPGLAMGVLILVMLPWIGVILAVFGSMLPATAMGRGPSLRKTLQAARQTGWPVLQQLGLIALPLLTAYFVADLLLARVLPRRWPSPIIAFAVEALHSVVFYVPCVVVAAILCRAFEQAYPIDESA